MTRDFLLERNNPIKDAGNADTFGRLSFETNYAPKAMRIKDLKIGMKSVSLKAKVLEVTKSTLVVTRFGNYANVANALISDDTGTIKLCLWNDQINCVSVGDTVQVENARISAFRGERQLRVGKNGVLSVAQDLIAD